MRALVVGGGVAGPACAVALQRVGIEAVVLERRPAPEPGAGSYLSVAANGLAALDAIGALEAVRAVGWPTDRNVMVSSSGRTLGTIPLGRPLEDGTVALTLKRAALAGVLAAEAGRRGADVRWGAQVAAVDPSAGRVTLADGTALSADVVVGADGLHSLVRRAVVPAAPAPRYVGLTNFGGITRRTMLGDGLPEHAWQFVFGRRAFFGAHRTPSGDVVWFVNVPREAIGRGERASTPDDRWQAWLVDLLRDDAGPAAELVRTGELELAGDSTHDLAHVPTWHRGRAVLLGDAAHAPSPSSGQGASLALEDAVVLAACLRDHGEPAAAFAAYEAVRRERVERVVRAGARTSSAKIPGRVGTAVRDLGMRVAFRWFVTERSLAWMTDHRVRLDAPEGAGSVP
jgi:2-polyprenyl-6-methoxyphenol hydroxylase-like FAD-dependent oxidoreductase